MGKGNFRTAGIFFFSLSNSLYEFVLGHSMNIFLVLIGAPELFSFNFPLREYFFWYFARPHHNFSNGPSLRKTSIQKYELPQNCRFPLPFLTVIAFHRAKKISADHWIVDRIKINSEHHTFCQLQVSFTSVSFTSLR